MVFELSSFPCMSLHPNPLEPDSDPSDIDSSESGLLIERRRILSGLGLAGLGCLFAGASSSASAAEVVIRSGRGKSNKLNLPKEWLKRNRYADAYHRYIESLKLKSIDPAQFIASHAKERGGVWNTLPPRDSWRRMGYVLKVVDRIAKEMNAKDVEVISAYRSNAYNARCRGAKKGSWHKENVAIDVSFDKIRASKVTKTARELRKLGLFNGGVGGYRNFTHVDARGYNADW